MKDTNLIEDLRHLSPPDLRVWLVLVGLVILGLAALRFWSRRSTRQPSQPQEAGAAPWETALMELERLIGLLRPEASRDYAIAATTILRRYVEQRFQLHAPRQATEEFLAAATRSDALSPEQRAALGRFLACGDLFKFGRFTAATGELAALHEAALAFVQDSRPGTGAPGHPVPRGGER
jgi:hypothetical protein